jgi:type IV pilus assembly protein PilE
MRQATSKAGGFTLVELAVVMVVTAILVAIAVPGYTSYVRTARRTDAKTALLGLASLEERYFSTSNAYSATPSDLGFPTSSTWPQTVGGGYYTVTVSNVNAATTAATATYTITANVTGTQTADADCQSFQILQNGTRSAIPNTDGNCWN